MRIRLRIDISQPLQFGTVAPNDKNSINRIDFVYQELPRLFCSFCHRLGHLREDCIELFLFNHQEILNQALPQDPPQPIQQVIGPFIEPEYDDAYYEEMYHNVDIEDPDPGSDWSTDWDINPFGSHASSGEDNSAISFLDGEGYKQDGFHSDTSTDSERTISAAWLVEENSNFVENQGFEQVTVSPAQTTEVQQPFSPSIFLVSDIEETELLSDTDMPSSPSSYSSPALKRHNPELHTFLLNSGVGSSSGPHLSRRVSAEETEQWTALYQPAKRLKFDSIDQPLCASSSISFDITVNNPPIDESSQHPAVPAAPTNNPQ